MSRRTFRRGSNRAIGVTATLAASIALVPTAAANADDTTVTASLSATSVTVGQPVNLTGTASGDLTGATVLLQRGTPGSTWTTDAGPVTVAGNTFTLPVPTGWYGSHRYRVRVTPGDGSPAYTVPSGTVQVTPTYTPTGSGTAFTYIHGKQVVRWNPCQVITYRVNLTNAPSYALRNVKGAVRRVSQATGLRFRYLGTSTRVPRNDVYGPYGDADLLIAWRTPAKDTALAKGVLGYGGPAWYDGYKAANGTSIGEASSGSVVMSTRYKTLLKDGFGKGFTLGQVMMHEIGHVVGLGHTRTHGQVMYPVVQDMAALYEAGDLAGLRRLGADQGCIVDPSANTTRVQGQTLRPGAPAWAGRTRHHDIDTVRLQP